MLLFLDFDDKDYSIRFPDLSNLGLPPSFGGYLTERLRIWIPSPHFLLQGDHPVQSLTTQSCGEGNLSNNPSIILLQYNF